MKGILLPVLALLTLWFSRACYSADDVVLANFESPTYGSWKTEGTAFSSGPVLGGKRAVELEVQGVRGDGLASSENNGDAPSGRLTSPVFTLARNYLSFDIAGGSHEHRTCLNLLIEGQLVRSATGSNSDRLASVTWDVRKYLGKKAQIQIVDDSTGDWGHINVDNIIETNAPQHPAVIVQPLYHETFRPQFHFSARQWTDVRLNPGQLQEGWMNDMNGLIYYDGEYHFFAQRWWRCWLHAVSKDLVHWTELPPAFREEHENTGVQSGTCVIDYGNTSGLSSDKSNPPMVAFWTRNDNRNHGLSYSLDHGRTWHFYDKNPILQKPERDPDVFWYAPDNHWVMVMYGDGQYHILTSPNLFDWKDENHPIPNSFECPNFFEMPVDGDKTHTKWVLVRGDGKYSVGSFNGTQFTEETPQYESDGGPNFYATQTWANTDKSDGRRIQVAWMRGGAYPDMPFNQQATFPCELTLRTTPDGLRLFRNPIREIALLHKREVKRLTQTLQPGKQLDLKQDGDLFHIKMVVSIPEGGALTLNVRGVPVVLTHYSMTNGTAPHTTRAPLQTVELLVDRTSIEAFANGGEVSLSRCFLPDHSGLSLQATGAPVTIQSLSIFPLESAWKGNSAYEEALK